MSYELNTASSRSSIDQIYGSTGRVDQASHSRTLHVGDAGLALPGMLGKKIGGVITTYSKVRQPLPDCWRPRRPQPPLLSAASAALRAASCAPAGLFAHTGGALLASQAKCLKVKLFSEANTGYFYTWKKNPKAYPWRIAMRKYDPIVRQHVLFKVRPASAPLPNACPPAPLPACGGPTACPQPAAAFGPVFRAAFVRCCLWLSVGAYLLLRRNARAAL